MQGGVGEAAEVKVDMEGDAKKRLGVNGPVGEKNKSRTQTLHKSDKQKALFGYVNKHKSPVTISMISTTDPRLLTTDLLNRECV